MSKDFLPETLIVFAAYHMEKQQKIGTNVSIKDEKWGWEQWKRCVWNRTVEI